MRLVHVFLGTLLASLIIQGFFWQHVTFLDKDDWLDSAQHLYDRDPAIKNSPVYGYPGGPPLLLSTILHHWFQLPFTAAYPGSVAVLNAAAIAAVASLCFLLRPRSIWWIGAAGVLAFNRLYFTATPPSALVAPLLTGALITVGYLYEHRQQPPQRALLVLGLFLGVATANRFDISLLVISLLAAVLWFLLSYKNLAVTAGYTLLFFALGDPFLWFLPIDHIHAFLVKAHYHYTEYNSVHISWLFVVQTAAFAIISLLLTLLILTTRQRPPLPAKYLGYAVGLTIVIAIILGNASYHALWYFLPLILFWETLLPLTLVHLNHLWHSTRNSVSSQQRYLDMACITLLLSCYLGLTLQLYLHQ